MSRGCGCQTGLMRFLPVPYSKTFYAACCIHDDDYDRGGSKYDRKRADLELFSNCMNIATHNYASRPTKCVWLSIIALFYYYAVRINGSRYFNYK